MKKKILALLSGLLLISFLFIPVLAQEGFEIDHYDVQMDIDDNGVYTVTETLDVSFFQPLHGIQLQIPKKYRNFSWTIDGQQIRRSYVFPIDHIEVLSGHEANIDDEGDYINIRLGSEEELASASETYQIRYQVHSRDLKLNGLQSFYWNIISQGWDTTIHHVTFSVRMPKAFDADQLSVYSDLNQDDLLFTLDGNTFSGETQTALQPFEGITVKLDLPEGYFLFPEEQDYSFIAGVAALVLTALGCVLFWRFGRDEPLIVPVEFSAPEGISSAEVGYILDGSVSEQDVLSLILDWAQRGFLRIEDLDQTLRLIRLADLPPQAPIFERRLFDALFRNRDSVTTEELNEKFYPHLHQAMADIGRYYKEPSRRLTTRTSALLQVLMVVLTPLPMALLAAIRWYQTEFSDTCVIWFFLFALILMAAGTLAAAMQTRWRGSGTRFKLGSSIALTLLIAIWTLALAVLFAVCEGGWLWPVIVWICSLTLVGISAFMSKRTVRGAELYGRVLGLRNFIQYAEEDRLKMLVEEDPSYFYSILPYAYAMGMTDLWSDHFRNLTMQPPAWYTADSGWTTWVLIHHLNHSMHHLHRSMTSVPHNADTSSHGGSFGGTGGGGFTGGGFGGTSGSGW